MAHSFILQISEAIFLHLTALKGLYLCKKIKNWNKLIGRDGKKLPGRT